MAKPILVIRINDFTSIKEKRSIKEKWIVSTDNEYHVVVIGNSGVDRSMSPKIEVHGAINDINKEI